MTDSSLGCQFDDEKRFAPSLTFAMIFFYCGIVHGQALTWIDQFGDTDDDYGRAVATDGLGNAFVVGSTRGDLGGPSAGNYDVFIRKYDAAGAIEWTRQFGTDTYDFGYACTVDASGSVYVTGMTEGPLGGVNPSVGYAYLAKYDSQGNGEWLRHFGTGAYDTANSVSVDPFGNVFVAGETTQRFGGGEFDQDTFVSKFDASGTQLWTRHQAAVQKEFVTGVSTDEFGNVFFSSWIYDDEHPQASIIKYDQNGESLWSRSIADASSGGIVTDEWGNVYLAGGTSANLDGPNAGGLDAYVAKYDAEGTLTWLRQFGSSAGDALAAIGSNESGDLFATGFTDGDFASPRLGRSDVFLVKLSSDGQLEWKSQLGTASTDFGYAIASDGAGSVFISGLTRGNWAGVNAGEEDAFVAKLAIGVSPLPGDTNGDGLVDLVDLNNVRNHFGSDGVGDTNGDNMVDLVDLNNVRNNFGQSSARPLPEPTALYLAMMMAASSVLISRKPWTKLLFVTALSMATCGQVSRAAGQSIDWLRQFGGPGTDPGRAVAVDVHGDVYVAGYYNVDPDDVLNTDFLILKYNPGGELLWSKQYDFTKTDRNWSGLTTDFLGNVYFGGSVSSGSGGRDAILVKVDSAGNQLWDRRLEAGGEETFRNLRTDRNGNVIVSGTTIGGSVDGLGNLGYDALVGKYDANGTQLWMRQLHGNQITEAWGLDVDRDGNVFVSGGGEEPSSKILSKLSSTGVALWDRRFDQGNFGNALSIAVDPAGNAFVAGTTSGSLGGPNAGGLDAFVRQYDGSGNVVWTQQFGTAQDDSIWGIAVGEAGQIVVGGHTNGSLVDAHAGLADAYVGVLNSTGAVTWFNQLGTPSVDVGQGVALGMDGAIYLAGFTDGALSDQSAMNTDFFLARFQTNISGDSDGDGDVDLVDLNNVRNDFGISGDRIAGDVNDDLVVDLTDLNLVRNYFGEGADAQPVAEPRAGFLAPATVLLGIAANAFRRFHIPIRLYGQS